MKKKLEADLISIAHRILKLKGQEDVNKLYAEVSELYEKLTVLKFAQARLSPPTYAQIASEAALETPEIYFEEINKKYIQRRNVLISELRKINGLKVASPKGAFYCIVELPIKDANVFAQWILEDFDVNNETIMVAPAEGFYSTKGLGKNQIRIAYVLNEEDLKKSVMILKKALDKYNN